MFKIKGCEHSLWSQSSGILGCHWSACCLLCLHYQAVGVQKISYTQMYIIARLSSPSCHASQCRYLHVYGSSPQARSGACTLSVVREGCGLLMLRASWKLRASCLLCAARLSVQGHVAAH